MPTAALPDNPESYADLDEVLTGLVLIQPIP